MTDGQKQRAADFFDGKQWEDLTEEEKKFYAESLRGRIDELLEAWRPIREALQEMVRRIIDHFNAWRKDLDERAEAGEPEAQYVKYSLEVRYWQERVRATEYKLQIAKQTNARRRLKQQLEYEKAQLEKFYELQTQALEGR